MSHSTKTTTKILVRIPVVPFMQNTLMGQCCASQAKHASILFEKETKKLVEVGIPQVDAMSLKEQTVSAAMKKHIVRKPVLEAGEEKDPENYEQIFKEMYQGNMPDTIVGLLFDSKVAMFKNNPHPLWEKVLM